MPNERNVTDTGAPRVQATPATIFGDASQEAIERPDVSMFDLPGVTEKRRALELARARGQAVDGVDPRESLDHRFHFVRTANEASGMAGREGEFRSNGYEPVKWDEAKKLGFTADPSLGHVKGPDGTIRVGDTVLMAAPAEMAAANLIRHQRRTERAANSQFRNLQARAAEMGTAVQIIEDEPRDNAR